MITKPHIPVLLEEIERIATDILNSLNKPNALFVDLTLGYAGHSISLLNILKRKHTLSNKILLSLDWDINAINYVLDKNQKYIHKFFEYTSYKGLTVHRTSDTSESTKWYVVRANFAYLPQILDTLFQKGYLPKKTKVDFLLADLGVSTPQLEDLDRGFSFKTDKAILDMRMDPTTYKVKAADLLNILSHKELKLLFINNVGMSPVLASKLAWSILYEREQKPFGSKDDIKRLKQICEKLHPLRPSARKRLHPCTLVFLALRIAVNQELDNLKTLVDHLPNLLSPDSKAAIITFHSAEQKIIERHVATANLSIENVIIPKALEINKNPAARSAKMYILTRR